MKPSHDAVLLHHLTLHIAAAQCKRLAARQLLQKRTYSITFIVRWMMTLPRTIMVFDDSDLTISPPARQTYRIQAHRKAFVTLGAIKIQSMRNHIGTTRLIQLTEEHTHSS